jgi:glucose uptake protein GlcU
LNAFGFFLALVAMVLFGLYMVPRKLSRLRDFDFVLSMCIGTVIFTQIARLLAHPSSAQPMSLSANLLALSCGLVWTFGMLSYTLSVTQMGLALATPIKNTTAVIGTVFGLVIFAEWRETNAVLTLIGSVLVVACAIILARAGNGKAEETPPENAVHTRSTVNPLGVFWALMAALGFAAYAVPFKFAQRMGMDSYTLTAQTGIGTLIGSALLFVIFSRGRRRWFRESLRDHFFAALCGAIWAAATITMAEAILRIGLAVTWPVTNLNTIVTVAAGIFWFHEIDARKHARTIVIAMLCATVGSLLLGVAR